MTLLNFEMKRNRIALAVWTAAIALLLTICLIRSFKNYATIAGLTGGGPGTSTKVVSMLIYADAFSYMKFSIASAEGIIFAAFIIILNRVLTKVRTIWERR